MKKYTSKRRRFLRVIGGTGVISLTAPNYLMGAKPSASLNRSGVLLEASSFDDIGGWKIDTQHYLQMGGNYLLAHGMGKPVEDAETTIDLPALGKWNVWVRNRDWCKGDWQSPGRFQVLVDGKPLEVTMGEGEESWHWQSAGSVEVAKSRENQGFSSRLDRVRWSLRRNFLHSRIRPVFAFR